MHSSKHLYHSSFQFDELWSKLPVNEFGNLDYQAFLKSYSATEDPPGTARPGTNRNSSGAGGGKGDGNVQSPPGTAARPGTLNGSRAGGGSDILRLNTADADQGRGAKVITATSCACNKQNFH